MLLYHAFGIVFLCKDENVSRFLDLHFFTFKRFDIGDLRVADFTCLRTINHVWS